MFFRLFIYTYSPAHFEQYIIRTCWNLNLHTSPVTTAAVVASTSHSVGISAKHHFLIFPLQSLYTKLTLYSRAFSKTPLWLQFSLIHNKFLKKPVCRQQSEILSRAHTQKYIPITLHNNTITLWNNVVLC